ncbi:hypothetical protein BDK51DRAFT_50597 [Blyttiomyces helicus]|uniref:Uncharacterized protein n=1 Tax=Blyttiomyces helicus TaxID=388810 RepID=A0A4V1ISS7_9FUNG|nr:hypothetical protein BDK51DRAFT_50597 [Blyttiomyces helicus]|eukprot:RKO94597.1 hypothetical protein BDK51DRAFT_50597 [Blyttiomyces helicus]
MRLGAQTGDAHTNSCHFLASVPDRAGHNLKKHTSGKCAGYSTSLPILCARLGPGGQAHRRQPQTPLTRDRASLALNRVPNTAIGHSWQGMEDQPQYMKILDHTIGQLEQTGCGTELEGPVDQDGADRAGNIVATMVGDCRDTILSQKGKSQGTSKPIWEAKFSAEKRERKHAQETIPGLAMKEKRTPPVNNLAGTNNMNPSELLKSVSNLQQYSSGNPTSSALPTEPTTMDPFAAHYKSVSTDLTQPPSPAESCMSHRNPRPTPSFEKLLFRWQFWIPMQRSPAGLCALSDPPYNLHRCPHPPTTRGFHQRPTRPTGAAYTDPRPPLRRQHWACGGKSRVPSGAFGIGLNLSVGADFLFALANFLVIKPNLASPPGSFYVDGTPIPFPTSLKYLRFPFKTFDIDHHALLLCLIRKGYTAVAPLNAISFDDHSFPLPRSSNLYRNFTCPALECAQTAFLCHLSWSSPQRAKCHNGTCGHMVWYPLRPDLLESPACPLADLRLLSNALWTPIPGASYSITSFPATLKSLNHAPAAIQSELWSHHQKDHMTVKSLTARLTHCSLLARPRTPSQCLNCAPDPPPFASDAPSDDDNDSTSTNPDEVVDSDPNQKQPQSKTAAQPGKSANASSVTADQFLGKSIGSDNPIEHWDAICSIINDTG